MENKIMTSKEVADIFLHVNEYGNIGQYDAISLIKSHSELSKQLLHLTKQIESMRNCQNCYYKDYQSMELPCNECIRCFDDNTKDYWEIGGTE